VETGGQVYRTPAGTFRVTYSDLILAGDYLFMFRGGYEGALEGVCQIMKAGREVDSVGETRLEKVVSNNRSLGERRPACEGGEPERSRMPTADSPGTQCQHERGGAYRADPCGFGIR
jgi:hypothetical protein